MGFIRFLLVIHSVIVVFLIMMILIQRTDSDGLSGLSGGGGNQFLSGRTTANLMTRTTAILAALFMISSLTLAAMAGRMNSGSIVDTAPVSETSALKTEPKETVTKPSENAPSVPKPE